jgi:hypothetical protein
MRIRINTIYDLRRCVSEWCPHLELENYKLTREELDEEIAWDLLTIFVKEHKFKMGDYLPRFDDEMFINLYAKYEKE